MIVMTEEWTPQEVARAHAALGAAVGGSVHADVWAYLVEGDYLAGLIEGWRHGEDVRDALEDLRSSYLKLARLGRGQGEPQGRTQRALPPDDTLKVTTMALAARCAALPQVTRFRIQHLGGRLLAPEDIPAWVRAHPHHDAASANTRYARATAEVAALVARHPAVEGRIDVRTLPFRDEADGVEFDETGVVTERGAVLDDLRSVAQTVTRESRWPVASAVRFILAGTVPEIPRLTVVREWETLFPAPDHGRGVLWERIHIDAHPTVSRAEVARVYQEARADTVFAGRRQRNRPPTRPRATLVRFVQEHEGTSWAERMASWNATSPSEWRYNHVANMQRDYRKALKQSGA